MHRVHRSHSVTGTHSKRFEWMEKQWPCIRGNPRDRNESEDGLPGSDAETADGILSPILGGGESGGRGGGGGIERRGYRKRDSVFHAIRRSRSLVRRPKVDQPFRRVFPRR